MFYSIHNISLQEELVQKILYQQCKERRRIKYDPTLIPTIDIHVPSILRTILIPLRGTSYHTNRPTGPPLG